MTALMYACCLGPAVVELLLKVPGIDIDYQVHVWVCHSLHFVVGTNCAL